MKNIIHDENLPKILSIRSKEYTVDWEQCENREVNFVYDDIVDYFTILKSYIPRKGKRRIIYINYNNYIFDLTSEQIYRFKFMKMICIKRPDIIKYIVDQSLITQIGYGCKSYIDVKCDKCNLKKSCRVDSLCYHGFSCAGCCDGYSYPEKFMISVLTQLNISFIHQYKFNIDEKYKFWDFVIEDSKIIIEMDGGFHYSEHQIEGTLEEVQLNDKVKDEWALKNGYKVYRIDSRISTIEYIKNNIILMLNDVLNIQQVDFNLCGLDAEKSIMPIVCKYKNENPNAKVVDISKYFNINITTILDYLQRGHELNMCVFDDETRKRLRYSSRKIKKET